MKLSYTSVPVFFVILPCIVWLVRATAADQPTTAGVSHQGLELGFPEFWAGDSYRNVSCRVSEIPEWLDGYLVALVNAAYGRPSDPAGSKLTHMFDGLAALASIQFKDGMVRFSGKYLPTRAFKIWDFYGRDMNHSQVAWSTLRSPRMAKAKEKWDYIASEYLPYNPNMNLWKVGTNRVIAVAENPDIGLQFDVASLDNFQKADLHDTNDLFTGRSSVKLLNMAAHSRAEPDGTIYGTVSGVEPSTNRMYQFVFRINPKGVRTLEGAFEYGRYEPSKCGSDLRYMGDKRVLAGLVKSVVSTNQYLIIPITSAIVNPCKYQNRNRKYFPKNSLDKLVDAMALSNRSEPDHVQEFATAVEFGTDVPVRFLIFHKQKRQFVTNRPLDSYPPRFISHQINGYELDDNRIVVDMITYDNYDAYDRSLYVDYILRDSVQQQMRTRPVRFTIDIQRGYIERSHLIPDTIQAPMEYPSINPKHNGRRYRYAYVVQPPFTLGSQLGKIDVEEHGGARNLYFSHGPSAVLGEPTFVPRPNANSEDDGVLLSLGFEMLSKRSVLYVVDAKTMKEVGRAEMPVIVPFGFHARYFDRQELTDSPWGQQSTTELGQPPTETIDSIFSKIYPNIGATWAPTKEATFEKAELEKPNQTPVIVVQHSNTEPGAKGSDSFTTAPTSRPILPTESPRTASTSSTPLATWPSPAVAVTSTPIPEPAKESPAPATPLKPIPFSSPDAGVRGFYLSNGTFLELFPDGSVKSYPPIPSYFGAFNPSPQTMPVTMSPPYLGVDPAFIQFVKSQIPPPLSFTTPMLLSALTSTSTTVPVTPSGGHSNQGMPVVAQPVPPAAVDAKAGSSSTTSTAYPRFIFPGFYGTKSLTTPIPAGSKFPKISPENSRPSNNSAYIVVDVLVDPNKRTRRPQPTNPVADDPDVASTTESPPSSASPKPRVTTTSTTTTVSSTEVEDTESTATMTTVTAPRKTTTTGAPKDHKASREVASASVANDAIGRFFERGRSFLCNFLGKAITALGSDFCKTDSESESKSIRTKQKPQSDEPS